MNEIRSLLDRSRVHDEWRPSLAIALEAMDQAYLASLLQDRDWLPGSDRLLAAFQRDRAGLRYLLIGESPYPRRESANGIAFFDAAVGDLWSSQGLSKAVNRATSLRNIVKTALLAELRVGLDADDKLSQGAIANVEKDHMVRTLAELFDNLEAAGFLMLNATPVLHPERKPAREAVYWRPFLDRLLDDIRHDPSLEPTLVLWGKIARLIDGLPGARGLPRIACEHPYNLSFIDNPDMRRLLGSLRLLQARESARYPARPAG